MERVVCLLVRDFMTPNPKTLKISDTLKDAAFLFYKYKVGGAPVVTSTNEVCGLVTRKHIIEANINHIPLSQPVSTCMTQSVIVVHPESTLEEAWQIPVGRLPVVDHSNKLVGMISRSNFITMFYSRMKRSNDAVQKLIRCAHDGVIIINSYGIVKVINETAARIIGETVQTATGKFIHDLIPNTGMMRIMETGEYEMNCSLEVNGQNLLVNRSPICEESKVVGALGIIQDVSANRDITKNLTTAQYKLEALECIFENMKQGVIVIDESCIVNLVNPAYEDIMGVPREELLGANIQDKIENSRMHIVLKTGVPEFAEVQIVKGRQVVVNRVPLFKNGRVVGGIGEALFKDINEVEAVLQRGKLFSHDKGKASEALKVTFESIIGRSRAIVQVKNSAAKAAITDSTVLIMGESGTGKDLFAQAIHNASKRSNMPLISINCAAIPTELLEAELFGYDEGAFTGAKKGGKKGRFELAEGGTLFLDEIGDMPLPMQAKLLRVMQDKTFEHIGGEKALACDVRIIAATNKPLAEMVRNNTFREDLYYRLNVICLEVPPLRDRREDIGELIEFLMPGICHRLGISVKRISPEALALLRMYDWPGNIRELINILEQVGAMVSAPVIGPKQLPAHLVCHYGKGQHNGEGMQEKEYIKEILSNTRGNKALAAKILGIHRSTLYEKIKKYKL